MQVEGIPTKEFHVCCIYQTEASYTHAMICKNITHKGLSASNQKSPKAQEALHSMDRQTNDLCQ